MCQQKMATKRNYEMKIINKCKKDVKRMFGPTKDRDDTWRIKTSY